MLEMSSQLDPWPSPVLAKKYRSFPSRSNTGLSASARPSVICVVFPESKLCTNTAFRWLSRSRAQVNHFESVDQRGATVCLGLLKTVESIFVFLPVFTSTTQS